MKSFRVRIIFLTSVIAGAVMLAFAVAGNLAYEQMKEKQVADSLTLFSERMMPPPIHERYWERAGPEMLRELERVLGGECLIAAYGREKGIASGEYTVVFWGGFESVYADRGELPEVEGEFEAFNGPGPGPVGPAERFGGRGRIQREGGASRVVSLSSKEATAGGEDWHIAVVAYEGYNVLLGVNLELVRRDAALMRRSFAIAFPVALAVMGLGIWFFVTRAILPVRLLSEAIEKVSAKSLGARLDLDGEYSEFAALIVHFNGMLERLERSFMQASRFSADAAHELKTPLAILQGQLEVALQAAEDNTDQQRQLAELLEETHRLKSITRKLLILAKADAGTLNIQRERVNLLKLVEDVVGLAREDAPDLEITLGKEGDDFEAWCDATLSRQILDNLIGNATKYRFPVDSPISVTLRKEEGSIMVEVVNSCVSLDKETRNRLFDRFVRVDAVRNRTADGTGLGLSLSLEFARAQRGDLRILSGTRSDELRISLQLPRFTSRSAVD